MMWGEEGLEEGVLRAMSVWTPRSTYSLLVWWRAVDNIGIKRVEERREGRVTN